ncbi:UNVERIFIED_CONTAM: hypothetical protein Sradi_7103500 [Sesamum radiatum]|uniref:Uncharacterized protein n=1 Tax=Sesamum radiatum TaxID=300843 RepID=A0AAW2J1K8_SESRA
MEPNESSSYNENREYFQILERQRQDVLRESDGNVTMVHARWRLLFGLLRRHKKMVKVLQEPTRPFPKEKKNNVGLGNQVQLSVSGNVVRRMRSTEVHGRIPARRNGKGKFLHLYLSKNYD